jgi:hypothetical protein
MMMMLAKCPKRCRAGRNVMAVIVPAAHLIVNQARREEPGRCREHVHNPVHEWWTTGKLLGMSGRSGG